MLSPSVQYSAVSVALTGSLNLMALPWRDMRRHDFHGPGLTRARRFAALRTPTDASRRPSAVVTAH